MNVLQRLTFGAFVLFTTAPFCAQACSCVSLSHTCDGGWNAGELVFLGKVVSKEGGERPLGNGITALTDFEVHFGQVEIFRGASKYAHEIMLYTGHGGGDCGYPFVVGKSYLVYAFAHAGRLVTGTCSETAPEVKAGGLVREFRALRDTGRTDDLFGTIGVVPRFGNWETMSEIQPLAQVPVHATSERGAHYSTTTDEHGVYAFASLPRGKYRLKQDLPAGYAMFGNAETGSAVDVRNRKGRGAACRVDAFPYTDGWISGKVVSRTGKGLPGLVTIREAEASMRRGGLFGDDTNDGTFSIQQLPPGRYQLLFSPKTGAGIPIPNTFYSNIVEVALGQHVENVRFEVP